jgi:hypothetical protein
VTRLTVALSWAAIRDGVALGAAVVRFVALDPVLCRLRGHSWHVWASGHHVLKVCDTCGTVGRAR